MINFVIELFHTPPSPQRRQHLDLLIHTCVYEFARNVSQQIEIILPRWEAESVDEPEEMWLQCKQPVSEGGAVDHHREEQE